MRWIVTTILVTALSPVGSSAQVDVQQLWNRARVAVQPFSARSAGLTDSKISAGLKEALSISTDKAVAATGRPDGFLKNTAIRIVLPDNLRKVGDGLRLVGMGSQVDQLEVGMNRAAEQATPEAKKIFLSALANMSFADAREILSGNETAATDYFRRSCSSELAASFAPIVHRSMENVGVIQQYNRVMQSSTFGVVLANQKRMNLDDYVVQKTLDGLFYMLGEEEKRIRTNPAAQTTDLLKQVFGAAVRRP